MNWIPAISTTALLAITAWMGRHLLITRLKASVQHEFNEKLEMLSAELREKSHEIDALRRGALSGIEHRQAALYDRKLRATEDLWEAINSMAGARNLSALFVSLNYDVAAEEAAANTHFRDVFVTLSKAFDTKKIDTTNALKSRPYLSKLAWAYYSAYNAIVMNAVVKMEMLKAGLTKDLTDTEQVVKLIKAALPHQSQYIEKHGISVGYYLLEELEEALLSEIGKILNGEEDDQASLEKAAKILKEADSLMGQLEKSKQKSN